MKKQFIVVLLILITKSLAAQNTVFYLDKQDNITDSAKAVSFMVVYEKGAADSVYSMRQFTLEKLLMVAGSFKDASFSIPHGNYYYYDIQREPDKGSYKGPAYKDTTYRKPVGRHLDKSGFFLNGKMEGVWKTYFPDGTVKQIQTFKHDVLDGHYEIFTANGKTLTKGNYLNGKRNGLWIDMGGIDEITYESDKIIKKVKNKDLLAEMTKRMSESRKYDVEPKPMSDFKNELRRFMAMANVNNIGLEKAMVTLIVNEKGEISEPQVSGLSDHKLMASIKEFFLKSKWQPGTRGKEKTPVRTMVTYTLVY